MNKLLIAILTVFGISNANTDLNKNKIDFVKNIDENSQLFLEHSNEFKNVFENDQLLAQHYSHRSHSSHSSHRSHYSHYSSR